MSDPYVGEVRAFGFNFTPVGWVLCAGQLLSISNFQALYAVVGTTYGGDGINTFAVPNLQGAAIMGQGNGPGLTPRPIGQAVGESEVTLLASQMPTHNHSLTGHQTNQWQILTAAPTSTSLVSRATTVAGSDPTATMIYSNVDQVNTAMAPQAVAPAGSSMPHENRQPYLVNNYCICTDGIFPQRP